MLSFETQTMREEIATYEVLLKSLESTPSPASASAAASVGGGGGGGFEAELKELEEEERMVIAQLQETIKEREALRAEQLAVEQQEQQLNVLEERMWRMLSSYQQELKAFTGVIFTSSFFFFFFPPIFWKYLCCCDGRKEMPSRCKSIL